MASLKADVWSSVLEDVKQHVGEQRFTLWFRNIRPLQTEDDSVLLGVPNLFVREWLETHFLDVLRQSFGRQFGKPPTVRFVIEPKLFQEARSARLVADASIVEEAARAATNEQKAVDPNQTNLRPDFTLDRFIVGPHNKLAHACVREILDARSNRLHPLFLHSLSGLGKSHLMQAMFHEIRQRDDGRTVEYLSAETFTNQFVYAMRSNRLDGFRQRYRNADILLIDDVHFLSNKTGLQEEFLHTYDAIDSGNKQLILASDVHPKMLSKIKQSLVNRFASGMIVRMGAPDFATKVSILKTKLHQQGRRVPEEVLRYVARGFEGTVRDLIGALTMVLAYAGLTGEKIDVSLARKALARLEKPGGCVSDVDAVETAVSRQLGVKREALRAPRQSRSTRQARQLCMYLARQCTNMSCREIAQHFGSSNHSTVIFAANRVQQMMRRDANYAELVGALTAQARKA